METRKMRRRSSNNLSKLGFLFIILMTLLATISVSYAGLVAVTNVYGITTTWEESTSIADFVWNDLDREVSVKRFGSEPTGLEIQSTLWGYNRKDALGDVIFRKIKFINKGGVKFDTLGTKGTFYLDSMYVGQWSDPDVGDVGNDLVGCDTILNIGYIYNSNDVDAKYRDFALPPPSCGYDILLVKVVIKSLP